MEASNETSFYSEDANYPCKERMKKLKKSMTLDLDNAPSPKKQKFSCLLSTPDLNMLKLASPELERLLIQQNSLLTTTPTPTQFSFPKQVTEEQESYVRGFVEALAELHGGKKEDNYPKSFSESDPDGRRKVSEEDEDDSSSCQSSNDNSQASTSVSSSSHLQASGHLSAFSLKLDGREDAQTVPSHAVNSPPVSPIDLADQERIKLERKRLRNRLAATKCRQMKLERISRLEDKVKDLKSNNEQLETLVSSLKERICFLKEQLIEHVHNGCKVIVPPEFLD